MNKSQLVDAVAEKSGLTKSQAEAALDGVLTAVTDAVASGDKVTLPGFGTFEARERSARTGRNPQTGAEIAIPAGKRVKVTAGSKLKAAVK